MRKLIIALIVLGLIVVGVTISNADQTRVINHNFRAITANIAATSSPTVLSAGTIYRITGYATGSNAVYAVYNAASASTIANTNVAIEGGEATSGDPLTMQYFGEEGLTLSTGMTFVVSNCVVVIEYL